MKFTFPATSDQMKAAGYQYDNDGQCSACDAPIEWWITPNGKKMPIVVVSTATVTKASGDLRQPHFVDCPAAKSFRK